MKCKEYIFKLTSDQFDKAPVQTKMEASFHRLICKNCRAFTANDAIVKKIMKPYKSTLVGGME